jgi:calcineurin-like phosphoesterase family protein
MPKTWFTADTHFGHSNIIRHCTRPFGTVEEMDASLIATWNAVVRKDDDIWHLGDFAYRAAKAPADYLRRLNGRKHFVWGNHDTEQSKAAPGWASSQAYAEITVEGTRMVLFHYGMRTWRGVGRGAVHLYGHSHGRLPGDSRSCDAGVDAWDYRPVTLSEILTFLETQPQRVGIDHHEG